eukprot:6491715-Amphidinium_carterae.2
MRHNNHDEVVQLREQLELERAKLEQMTWKEETRAQDIRVARETIVSDIKRCVWRHGQRITKPRNFVERNLVTRSPPEELTDFISQVDAGEAESMMALAMSTQPQQDLMPTTTAIFSDVEAPPSLIHTPAAESSKETQQE